MRNRFALALISLALVFCPCAIGPNSFQIEASDEYLVHNIDTGLDYAIIQEALDADETLNGHTILVETGTFFEHVIITKSISLVGESRETTIVDGNGTDIVLRISADNASVTNFTVRNGGHGPSWSSSCVYSEYRRNVRVENNIITNATNGIIFYGLSDSIMHQNLVQGLGSMGLHLDGGSINCSIALNTVMDCLEGIELERCGGNMVKDNALHRNNVNIVFNSCTGSNTLRNNNMTSHMYNMIIWGQSLASFVQDIDISNKVDGKTVYYFTNVHNVALDPANCPDAGYIAAANCTGITLKDFNLSLNRDGLLLAQSADCIVSNVTLGGNRGPLLHGGLTFFRSANNQIVDTRVTNNTVATCLYQSDGNLFYHNAFVGNDMQVVSDFTSPLSPPSGTRSIAEWDNGFEGNYWSNYAGVDLDCDGIGDTAHVIDANNTDNYPLMGMFSDFNVTYFTPPLMSHTCNVTVISNSSVSDFGAPIWIEHPEVIFLEFNVTGQEGSTGFCRVSFPTAMMNRTYHVFVSGIEVPCTLLPCSNADYSYLYFTYTHSTKEVVIIPEFPIFFILPLFMVATLLVAIVFDRSIDTSSNICCRIQRCHSYRSLLCQSS